MRWSLNQTRFALQSLNLAVFGVPIIGTNVYTASEEIGGEFMFGSSPVALGIVVGNISGTVEIGLVPEEDDKLLQTIGVGFAEIPVTFNGSFYEPAGSGVYTLSCDTAWIRNTDLDAAKEGAIIKRKLKTQAPISWNGITAIDLAARAQNPGQFGAVFSAAGLTISI